MLTHVFFLRSNESCKWTPDSLQPGKNQDQIFAKIFSEFLKILPGHETLEKAHVLI